MSFGKDQRQLDNIPPFGGSYIQRAKTQARKHSFSGSGEAHWKGNFRPSEHTPDTIRLIPGNYVQEVTHDEETVVQESFPYVILKEHNSGSGRNSRSTICSAGPLFMTIFSNNPKARPCHCCPIWAEDVRVRKEKKRNGDNSKGPDRMNMADKFGFGVWDYGLYFEVPDVDANGQPRMSSRTNQPYTSWVKGSPNDPRMQGRPWKQGNLASWVMGKTHKEALINHEVQIIGKMCRTCGTRDSIVTVMKLCVHCGQYIYDPHSTTLTDEERAHIDFYPYACKYCGNTGYVDEAIECNNPGCNNPARSTIFDVDLVVQRMKSGDGQQTTLQILNFSEPRPIQVADPEVLKTIQPLDLLKKFAPTPLEQQLKVHRISGQPSQETTAALPGMQTQPMGNMPNVSAPMMLPTMTPPMQQYLQPLMPRQPQMAPPMQQPQVQPQPTPLSTMPAIPYQPPPTQNNQ